MNPKAKNKSKNIFNINNIGNHKMNKILLAVLIGTLGLIFAAVGIAAISYVSAYNFGNTSEKSIEAQYTSNKNTLSSYTLKVAEAAQVPAMQRDDLSEVIEAAMNGRYGDKGSQAVFQWIQEQNPQINSEVYIKIQNIIESGRTEFKLAQDMLIDKKRVYETQLGSFWSGFWLRVAGYPRIDWSKFNIIMEDGVQKKFESGVDSTIQLR